MASHHTAETYKLVLLCGLGTRNKIFKRQTNCYEGDGQVATLYCGNFQSDSRLAGSCQWRADTLRTQWPKSMGMNNFTVLKCNYVQWRAGKM
jgi:hypothetical protein